MTTDSVFILLKKTDFNTILACLWGKVYRWWGVIKFLLLKWGVARAVASLTVPGGQEFHFPHFFPQVWIKFSDFSSNFSHFLPHFDPRRPWLRHWGSQFYRRWLFVNLGPPFRKKMPAPLGPTVKYLLCQFQESISSHLPESKTFLHCVSVYYLFLFVKQNEISKFFYRPVYSAGER